MRQTILDFCRRGLAGKRFPAAALKRWRGNWLERSNGRRQFGIIENIAREKEKKKEKRKSPVHASPCLASLCFLPERWKTLGSIIGPSSHSFLPLISIIAAFTISAKLFSLINLSVAVLLTTFIGAAANAHCFGSATCQHVPLSRQVLP